MPVIDELRQKLADERGADASGVGFLPFSDLDQSVRDDVRRIQDSPLLAEEITVSGFVYDVATGRLREIVRPTAQ